VQGLANRLPAHTELAGQIRFDEVLPRPEISADDKLNHGLVDRLAQGNWPCHRPDGPAVEEFCRVHASKFIEDCMQNATGHDSLC
jgi:hypothetical protein